MQKGLAIPREGTAVGDNIALLVQVAQEDPAAVGALYDRYVDRVYWYVRARTTTEEDALDLTQQIFLQMITALPRYRARTAPFSAWLFSIARRVIADFYRRRRSTIAWDSVPPALHPVVSLDIDAALLRREDVDRLRGLLSGLDADTRELLALRYAAGLTAAEIAAVIGKSEAATKKRLARTIQRLKEQYRDTEG